MAGFSVHCRKKYFGPHAVFTVSMEVYCPLCPNVSGSHIKGSTVPTLSNNYSDGTVYITLIIFLPVATSTLKIKNFVVQRNHPNSDSSVFFSFGAEPYISPSSSTVSTYEVLLYWTEEVSGRWGTVKVTRYSTRCPTGYFTTDGSSYSFSVLPCLSPAV